VLLGLPWPRLSQPAWRGMAIAAVGAAALNWGWMILRTVGA
jgi:hypothetical protein